MEFLGTTEITVPLVKLERKVTRALKGLKESRERLEPMEATACPEETE